VSSEFVGDMCILYSSHQHILFIITYITEWPLWPMNSVCMWLGSHFE